MTHQTMSNENKKRRIEPKLQDTGKLSFALDDEEEEPNVPVINTEDIKPEPVSTTLGL